MKNTTALVLVLASAVMAVAQVVPAKFTQRGDGYHAGTSPKQQIGFNGATPTAQRASINEAYAGAATGSITFSGNPTAADTVTVGTGTYTFTGTLTAANQVMIGATADATLSNFVNAVLAEGGNGAPGTIYGSGTVANGSALNATGAFAAVGATAAATGTLTSNNTNVTAADTVTIGGKVYTYQTAVAAEGDVLKGANADASLLNLIYAINHTGTPGTNYVCAAANASVSAASSVTSHAFAVTALTAGATGNTIATVTTNAGPTLSWGGTTLSGGTSIVNLVAAAAGTAGNSVVLTKSSSALSVSGSGTLSGGTATPSATQDAVLVNELRDAMVQKGLIKGSN